MHDGPRRPRPRGTLLIATLALLLPLAGASAQSLELTRTEATIAQPLRLEISARSFDGPAQPVHPGCLDAELLQPDRFATRLRVEHLAFQTDHEPARLRLSSSGPLQEPVVIVRVQMRCGAPYERDFTILGQAPRPAATTSPARAGRPRPPASGPRTASATRRTMKPEAASITPEAAPGPSAGPVQPDAHATKPPSAASPPDPTPPPAAAPRLQAGSHDEWISDIAGMRQDLQRHRLELAALTHRLERNEASHWQPWGWLAALGITLMVGHALATLMRDQWLRRFHLDPTGPGSMTSRRPRPSPTTAMKATTHAAATTDLTASTPRSLPSPLELTSTEVPDSPPAVALPPEPSRDNIALARSTWAHADFGQSTLDAEPRRPWLAEVDRISAEGYVGAAVALLEQALQRGPAKHPALLMRLLKLYAALHQPDNHERVGAQLEALYQVRVPAWSTLTDEGTGPPGDGLLADEPLMRTICSNWPATAADTLAELLLPRHQADEQQQPRLELEAFDDALLLHAIARDVGRDQALLLAA